MKILLLSLFTFLSLNSYCQIVHVDLNPGYWVESVTPTTLISAGSETRLDLNNDGVDDYFFRLDFADFNSWWWCHLDTDSQNELLAEYPLDGISPFPIPFPSLLNLGDTINDSAIWGDVSLNVNAVLGMRQNTINVNEPHLMNMDDQYIGLRFAIGDEKHYAWMRLNATVNEDSMSVTIKEYAYESSPNIPIIVGDTIGIISSLFENDLYSGFLVYPNPADDYLNLREANSANKFSSYSIVSQSGKIIQEDKLNNTTIPIEMIPKGLYYILFRNDKNILVAGSQFIKL